MPRASLVTAFSASLLALLPIGAAAAQPLAKPIAAAAAHPSRAADLETDKTRKGPQIAEFAGIREGDHVVDLIPSGGYWTRLFAAIVGPAGRVDGLWPASYALADHKNVAAYLALAQAPDFKHVRTYVEPAHSIALDGAADVFFTSLNYHDYPDPFVGPVSPEAFNRQVYAALKPGGIYVVIDHAGAAGTAMSQIGTLHRIEPALVRRQIEAAGFRFVGESTLLRNAQDDRSLSVFDPKIRGRTDRFVYKFRKPGGPAR